MAGCVSLFKSVMNSQWPNVKHWRIGRPLELKSLCGASTKAPRCTRWEEDLRNWKKIRLKASNCMHAWQWQAKFFFSFGFDLVSDCQLCFLSVLVESANTHWLDSYVSCRKLIRHQTPDGMDKKIWEDQGTPTRPKAMEMQEKNVTYKKNHFLWIEIIKCCKSTMQDRYMEKSTLYPINSTRKAKISNVLCPILATLHFSCSFFSHFWRICIFWPPLYSKLSIILNLSCNMFLLVIDLFL